jgi:hypothetical protein
MKSRICRALSSLIKYFSSWYSVCILVHRLLQQHTRINRQLGFADELAGERAGFLGHLDRVTSSRNVWASP